MIEKLIDLTFLVVWILFPFLCFSILRLSKIGLWNLTLPSFVVVSILIFQYIGFPILYFELDDYRAELVTDKFLILQAWLITSITTLLICIGSFFGFLILGRISFFKVKKNNCEEYPKYISKRVLFVAFLCIFVLCKYVLNVGFNNLALLVSLNSTSFDAAHARSLMGNDFGGSYHWYNVFMRDVLMFTSLFFFASKWMNVKEKYSFYIPFLLFAIVTFSLTMATEKGLFADYLIVLMLLYILVNNKGTVSMVNIVVLVFPLFASLVLFYMIFMGDSNIVAGISSVFSRALSGSIQPVYHYLEFFPYQHDWLYGASFPNPGGLFPFTPYNLTVEVMNFVVPDHLSTGIVGTMPAIYWAELYANFGYFGILIFPLVIGLFLYCLNWMIFRLKYDPLNLALFAWLLVHYKNLSVTGVSMFLFDFSLYMVILIYLLIKTKIVIISRKNFIQKF